MSFEDWLVLFWPPARWPMTLSDIERWRVAYNAVYRAAREECARICENRARIEYDAGRANAACRCADKIRETIK